MQSSGGFAMRAARCGRRWFGVMLVGAAVAGGPGCLHSQGPMVGPGQAAAGGHAAATPIMVPPQGAVARELEKVTLPPYVIEAPDNLLIEVILRAKVPDQNAPEAKKDEKKKDEKGLETTDVQRLPVQAISGPFQVRIDGSVGLGFYGSVTVEGLSLEQAAAAIRNQVVQNEELKRLGTRPESVIVIVDVLAYNSKRYYVVTDGGGYGEQVYPFPVTGSETVLDAMANINGLPAVASRRNIWVARRCPHPNQPWQILPVDWVGITQHGITTTNYQIMPGDRIYVKAQRLVTIDTALGRILSPVERLFGVTLLGANTVNQIKGNVGGFNNGAVR